VSACEGPSGAFTTTVQSHRNGDLVFHQTYTYRPQDFLAGVHGGRAWQRDPTSAIGEAGDDGRPVGLTFENPLDRGAPTIDVEYGDWRRSGELNLPSQLVILHGKERWDYRFTDIGVDALSSVDFAPQAAAERWEGPAREGSGG